MNISTDSVLFSKLQKVRPSSYMKVTVTMSIGRQSGEGNWVRGVVKRTQEPSYTGLDVRNMELRMAPTILLVPDEVYLWPKKCESTGNV